MRTIEIGLPFFDSINKQSRNKTYFAGYLRDWLVASDRFPPFQFMGQVDSDPMQVFNLVNVETGTATDYLDYFNANVTIVDIDISNRYLHLGNGTIKDTANPSLPANGRYYFYAKTQIDGADIEWWSEVFLICSDMASGEVEYLKISESDYLLTDSGSSKIII